jgi:hypothetical protein
MHAGAEPAARPASFPAERRPTPARFHRIAPTSPATSGPRPPHRGRPRRRCGIPSARAPVDRVLFSHPTSETADECNLDAGGKAQWFRTVIPGRQRSASKSSGIPPDASDLTESHRIIAAHRASVVPPQLARYQVRPKRGSEHRSVPAARARTHPASRFGAADAERAGRSHRANTWHGHRRRLACSARTSSRNARAFASDM